MRLIALLNYYDESPTWLAATITSLTKIGVDHVIASDGGYPHFPGAKPRSGQEQAEAIHLACDSVGIGLTLDRPGDTQALRTEVEKRAYQFALAAAVGDVGTDWLLVIDADEVVSEPAPIKRELAGTTLDVGLAHLWYRTDAYDQALRGNTDRSWQTYIGLEVGRSLVQAQTRLFRLVPQLTCVGHHAGFVAMIGDELTDMRPDIERKRRKHLPAAPVMRFDQPVVIEHRDLYRERERALIKTAYYETRDQLGVERAPHDSTVLPAE